MIKTKSIIFCLLIFFVTSTIPPVYGVRQTWDGDDLIRDVVKTKIPANEDELYDSKAEVEAARDGETDLITKIDTLQISSSYTLTCTPQTSGTVTLDPSNNTLYYYKTGKKVTVHGEISVSAISSPLGRANFNLPNVGTPVANSVGIVATTYVDLDIDIIDVYLKIPPVGGMHLIQIRENDTQIEFSAAKLTGNESFIFNFSYIVN